MERESIVYPEGFRKKVVNEIESGIIGVVEARRRYQIGGKMTISKWRKKYGNCDKNDNNESQEMKRNKIETNETPEGRIAALEKEVALYKRLIEVSEYFKDPGVKKKIGERLSAYYGENSEELEQVNIPWLKSVLYSASADKPITSTEEEKRIERHRK
jgi:transposase-like protein